MRIVHQHDVVSWVMRLDEIHLEDEGFFVGVDDDEIKMINMADHGENLAALWAKEILGHSVFQVLGFANVDDFIIYIFHQIDAWLGWKERYLAFKFLT